MTTTPRTPAELLRHRLRLLLQKDIRGSVEMRGVGRQVEADAPYDMRYIAVVTVEDGLITSYRDYWNPLAATLPAADHTGANR
ncbi:hypothetical protein LG634_21240 [Streptomyces bambusae]|nr:hypothetical protein [Streptomyces bambusae]MCB5167355.1 hypothetical protein [Streptomyces bambusae]